MKGPELRRCLEEALAIVRTLGESALTAEVLSFLSSCAFHDLDLERSVECAEEAVSIARTVGDQGLLGRSLVRKATAVSVDDLLGASRYPERPSRPSARRRPGTGSGRAGESGDFRALRRRARTRSSSLLGGPTSRGAPQVTRLW